MSEEHYNKLVEMIGQMAEQITSNLTTKIEYEVAALREEVSAKIEYEVKSLREEMRDLTMYTKRRIDIVERRQQNADGRIEVVEIEIRNIKDQLDHQQP